MAGSKFALPDEDEGGASGEQLTHLGRSLAELEDLQEVGRAAHAPFLSAACSADVAQPRSAPAQLMGMKEESVAGRSGLHRPASHVTKQCALLMCTWHQPGRGVSAGTTARTAAAGTLRP